jgi:hypothetical protein
MKRLLKLSIIPLLLSAILVVPISGAVLADEYAIDIVVSPNVINLESRGGSIFVHTDIEYVPVAEAILKVAGTSVDVCTFPDNCGNLVVKTSVIDVKEIVSAGEQPEFILAYNIDGKTYTGSDTVPIIQIIPQKS